MTSDFPVACLLSGGIDSASISSLVSKLNVKKNFQCFSTYSNDPKYDESKYIKTWYHSNWDIKSIDENKQSATLVKKQFKGIRKLAKITKTT